MLDNLTQSPFYILNKALLRAVGVNAGLLLSDLISRRGYFRDRGQLQADGSFFTTCERIKADTGLGRYVQERERKRLKMAGLIRVVKRGLPAVNHYVIDDEKVLQLLQSAGNLRTGQLETCALDSWFPTTNKNIPNKNKKNEPGREPKSNSLGHTGEGVKAPSSGEGEEIKGGAKCFTDEGGELKAKRKHDGRPMSKRCRAHLDRIERLVDLSVYLEEYEVNRLMQIELDQNTFRNGLNEQNLKFVETLESRLSEIRILKDGRTKAESEVEKSENHLCEWFKQAKMILQHYTVMQLEEAYREKEGDRSFALATSRWTLKDLLRFHGCKTKDDITEESSHPDDDPYIGLSPSEREDYEAA